MDPTELLALAGSLARAGLPALSTVVGAVVPPPYNLLSGLALSAIRLALGMAPDIAPTEVARHVDADPQAAQAALAPVEHSHAAAAADIDAYLTDVQNARAATVQLAVAKSPLAWGSPVISTVVVGAFAIVSILVFARYGVESAVGQLIAGALIAKFGTVVDFWLGSSKGASDRADQMTAILHQAIGDRGATGGSAPVAIKRVRP